MKKAAKKAGIIIFCVLMCITVFSCGEGGGSSEPFEPQFYANSYNGTEKLSGGATADFSTASDGYVGFKVTNSKQMVIQVLNGEDKYNFFVPGDGSLFYIPLNMGNGSYKFRIMQNTVDNKYLEKDTKTLDVTLSDEFAPFLHANLYTMYDENSACVKKAAELTENAVTEKDYIKAIYQYISDAISYDKEAAQNLKDGYVPDPDRTFESGKGICFDYSSLAAAMLRSQGIPTKIVTGYVGSESAYHAWNYIYTKKSGWISLEIRAREDDWTRMDVTFASSGSGQAVTYVDRYVY